MTDADLAANYAKAYDNRIGFGKKPALVLVDSSRPISSRQARFMPVSMQPLPVHCAFEQLRAKRVCP